MAQSKRTPPSFEPPRLPWRALAAGVIGGALLLAVFIVQAGSPVAIAGVLLVCAIVALAVFGTWWFFVRRWADRRGKPRSPRLRATIYQQERVAAPPAKPEEPTRASEPPRMPALPLSRPPQSPIPVDDLIPASAEIHQEVSEIAQRIAGEGVQRLGAPAASVLIVRGKRLVAAGTAGNWSVARRLQDDASVTGGARTEDDAEPPTFSLDQYIPDLLALYPKALPIERWETLADTPDFLLPLAALGDGGVGAAVSLRHRRQLAGLCVVARRPKGHPYTDTELRSLDHIAEGSAAALAAALAGSSG